MALLGSAAIAATGANADGATKENTSKSATNPGQLFSDDVLIKGKGVEVRRSELDEAFLQFKANLNARGQILPEERREQVEAQWLARLVITKLLTVRATEDDRKKARTAADKSKATTSTDFGQRGALIGRIGAPVCFHLRLGLSLSGRAGLPRPSLQKFTT